MSRILAHRICRTHKALSLCRRQEQCPEIGQNKIFRLRAEWAGEGRSLDPTVSWRWARSILVNVLPAVRFEILEQGYCDIGLYDKILKILVEYTVQIGQQLIV